MGLKMKLRPYMVVKKVKYDKDFIKIKFEIDDDLPLNTQLKFPAMTIVVRSVFKDEGKFYCQTYLDECLYEL